MKFYLTRMTSSPSLKRMRHGCMLSVLFCLFSTGLFAQEHQVSGQVTDANKSPIPGVNIVVKGTTIGTVTDLDGKYTLKTPEENAVVVFSVVGYTSQEFSVTGNQVVDVSLEEEVQKLNEVVVIGYGTQKTSLVTGAISSVNAEDLENVSNARVEDALQGKTSGVFVVPESGSPGSGVKVRIRGTGTNGSSNPLYIVDGIRMSDIYDISPNDIESVEVLKDAASSAIYGAEGGNGIVILTTKSGARKKGSVNYNFSYGLQSVGHMPELLNAEQYKQYQSERDYTVKESDYDTDWLDELFETAPMSTHNLSFSGGGEAGSYFASFTYFNQDGIVGGDKSKFKRFTARLNMDRKIKKWLKVSSNMNYARSKRTYLNEDDEFGGIISSALLIDPYTPTHYAPEDITSDMQSILDDEDKTLRMDSDGRYFAISENVTGEMTNPLLQLDLATGKTITDRLTGIFSIEITPFKGVTLTSRPGIDYSRSNYHDWTPLYYYSAEASCTSLSVNDNMDSYYQWQWENFASYTASFQDHNLTAIVGMSAQESKDKYLYTNTTGMPYEGENNAEHDYTSNTDGTVSGNEFPNRLVSYFGRVSYDYKGRYMLQATLRNDKTSTTNVPIEGSSGIFPSVSAGWTLSEENFFPKGVVNNLKLRGSWGQNGSIQSILDKARDEGQFLYTSTITSEGLHYPTGSGYVIPSEPSVLPNPDLTWETSEQTDIGIDVNFWSNRISLSADYYIKKTKDLLMIAQYPATAGTDNPWLNAGDVENKGFEFNFGFRNRDHDLKYSLNFNFATLKNEVTNLNLPSARLNGSEVGTGSWSGATAFEVGQPIWYFRGYETNGIDPNTGDPVFVDQNNDELITDDDRVYLGDPHPDIMYGANLSVEYKNFDLNIFLQGQAGNQIIYGWMRTDNLESNRLLEFYEDRWTSTNTDASMPAAGADSKMYASDIMVKDGDYMRIKQIQLGYTIPNSILEIAKFTNFRVYASLDDYFTFTKYEGMDPEAGSATDSSIGIDRGVYPTPRRIMFGLSASF